MFSLSRIRVFVSVAALLSMSTFAIIAYAGHSWGGFHWARKTSSFTLKLGDNVTSTWDGHLATASTDWTTSTVLDTTIVTGGTTGAACLPTSGRIEVCNSAYGSNGWLGLAQIWMSGNHITKGTAQMNDTYFNVAPYNTAAWRQLVICQEIGHPFGLGHQDENFYNANLGTCMDYTADPDGKSADPDQLSNEKPNQHDYDQLKKIYKHFDRGTTVSQGVPGSAGNGRANVDLSDPSAWGEVISTDSNGRSSLYERDLGNGEKLFTFVTWAN